MSSFVIYFIGFVLLLAGLAYAGFLLGLPPVWIGIGALVLLGIGVMTGVSKTRQKDETPTSE